MRNNASVCQLKLKYSSPLFLSLSLLFFLFKNLDDKEREREWHQPASSSFRNHDCYCYACMLFAIVINTKKSKIELNLTLSQLSKCHLVCSVQQVSVCVCVYIQLCFFLFFFSHRSFIGCRHNDWETIITKQQLLLITVDEAKRLVKLNRALLIFLTRELSKAIVRRCFYPIDLRYRRICWQISILLKEKEKKKTLRRLSICSVSSCLSLSL